MVSPAISALLAASVLAANPVLAAPANPAVADGACGKIVTIETHGGSTTRYTLAQGPIRCSVGPG